MSRFVDPLYTARGQIICIRRGSYGAQLPYASASYLTEARRGALLRLPRPCEEILHEGPAISLI